MIFKNLDDERAKELISVPLNLKQSFKNLEESLATSDYNSRALVHARRLLSMYLLSQTSHYGKQMDHAAFSESHRFKIFFFKDFFGVSLELEEGNLHAVKENEDEGITRSDFDKERTVFKPHQLNEFFNVNPIEFKNKTFENDKDVFVKEIQIDLNSVIESYQKSISIKNVFIQQNKTQYKF